MYADKWGNRLNMLLHMLTLTMTPQVVVPDAKPVTCVHYDTLSDLLWLGHADGQVTAFAVSPGQTAALDAQHVLRWQAQRTGAVTAIARTAQGDLWTGSSRGSVRIWAPEFASAGGAVPAAPGTARELRRPPGARQPHSSAVAFLLAPATGQVQMLAMLSAVLTNWAVKFAAGACLLGLGDISRLSTATPDGGARALPACCMACESDATLQSCCCRLCTERQ